MSSPNAFRRWSSLAKPPLQAAELALGPIGPDALAQILNSISARDLKDVSFLLVRLIRVEGEALHRAIAAANASALPTRVCLAVDRFTLEAVGGAPIDDRRVGLVLDDVDADTPLSCLVSESVEAVRFHADFVTRAGNNLRLGVALEAMLDVSRHMGLCTFGPATAANESSLAPNPAFDFVPSSLTNSLNLPQHAGHPTRHAERPPQFIRLQN